MQLRKYIDAIQCMCTPSPAPSCPPTPTCPPTPPPAATSIPCYVPGQSARPNNTVAGLECALTFLQEKCRNKDRMITELADELRHRADAQSFQNVLKNIAAERDTICSPCESRQVMRTPAEKPCAPKEGCQCISTGELVVGPSGTVDPSPLAITEVRKIANDSLLVKWERPNSSQIKGYEVEVNGEVKSRVHSATRTAAVLNGLPMDIKMTLTVYAVSVTGTRCHPPAKAVYQPRPATPTSQACRC